MKTIGNEGAFGFMFENFQQPGLTKREYFAAMAMQGMLHLGAMTEGGQISQDPDVISKQAVLQADALIEALNK